MPVYYLIARLRSLIGAPSSGLHLRRAHPSKWHRKATLRDGIARPRVAYGMYLVWEESNFQFTCVYMLVGNILRSARGVVMKTFGIKSLHAEFKC